MIKPTVGRVVWYWHSPGREQPEAALITWVHTDTMVNLAIFSASGEIRGRTSVLLYQGEDDRPLYGFCEWMPYQLGQAAKELHPVSASHWGLKP